MRSARAELARFASLAAAPRNPAQRARRRRPLREEEKREEKEEESRSKKERERERETLLSRAAL